MCLLVGSVYFSFKPFPLGLRTPAPIHRHGGPFIAAKGASRGDRKSSRREASWGELSLETRTPLFTVVSSLGRSPFVVELCFPLICGLVVPLELWSFEAPVGCADA